MKYRKEGKAKQSERLCMEELRSSIDVLKFIQLPLLQLIQLMVLLMMLPLLLKHRVCSRVALPLWSDYRRIKAFERQSCES